MKKKKLFSYVQYFLQYLVWRPLLLSISKQTMLKWIFCYTLVLLKANNFQPQDFFGRYFVTKWRIIAVSFKLITEYKKMDEKWYCFSHSIIFKWIKDLNVQICKFYDFFLSLVKYYWFIDKQFFSLNFKHFLKIKYFVQFSKYMLHFLP